MHHQKVLEKGRDDQFEDDENLPDSQQSSVHEGQLDPNLDP